MNDIEFNKSVRDFVKTLKELSSSKPSPYDTQAEVKRIEGNTAWVHIPGGVDETPVQLTTSAKKGDVVQVRISGGRAWLYGNQTSPPTDDTKANEADEKAGYAEELSLEALEKTKTIQNRVDEAEANITEIENDITILDGRVETAEGNITTIEGDISTLDTRVNTAEGDITTIEGNISGLTTRVSDAENDIDDTLKGLALAQDIIGTLAWITAHSTVTTDATPVSGKTYYIKNQDNTFTIVTDTTGKNPSQEGWYEMDEAMANYVAAHLAMTNDGLVVTKDNSKWKVLVKDNGIDIIDATSGVNKVVASYGAGIDFDNTKTFHIGNQDAYIVFNPANGGSITIGGANITLGDSRTLDDVVTSVDNTLIYDHTYTYSYDLNNKPVSATFTAFLYRGGVDVKTEFTPASEYFYWYLKKEDHDGTISENLIGTGYTCTVNLSDCGYGAEVIGKFITQDNAEALTNNGDNLSTIDDDSITVRATGDKIRVRDLTTSSAIFPAEKLLVIGAENEHLITAETLYNYILTNLSNEYSIIYCGSATELVG